MAIDLLCHATRHHATRLSSPFVLGGPVSGANDSRESLSGSVSLCRRTPEHTCVPVGFRNVRLSAQDILVVGVGRRGEAKLPAATVDHPSPLAASRSATASAAKAFR